MSKNMNDKAKKVNMPKANLQPKDYGYRNGDKVEIEGAALSQLLELLETVARNGQKVVVTYPEEIEGESYLDYLRRVDATKRVDVTSESHLAQQLGSYLAGVHIANIQSDKAVPYAVLQQELKKAESKGDEKSGKSEVSTEQAKQNPFEIEN